MRSKRRKPKKLKRQVIKLAAKKKGMPPGLAAFMEAKGKKKPMTGAKMKKGAKCCPTCGK